MGSTLEKMCCDKISAISTRLVLRRAKGLFDLYLLSGVAGYSTINMKFIFEHSGNTVSNFNEFLNKLSDVEHAYNKLEGIRNKPSFQDVYSRVHYFVSPFIDGTYKNHNLIWNTRGWIAV